MAINFVASVTCNNGKIMVWPQIACTRIAPSFALEYAYSMLPETAQLSSWRSLHLNPKLSWIKQKSYLYSARLYYSDNHLIFFSNFFFVRNIRIYKKTVSFFFFLLQSIKYLEFSRFKLSSLVNSDKVIGYLFQLMFMNCYKRML